MKEENLIVLISQPRSGSTFLQNLISNNSKVNTCSESWVLLSFLNQLKPDLLHSPIDMPMAQDALSYYKNSFKSFDFKQLDKEYILNYYTPLYDGFDYVLDKTPRYWEITEELINFFPKAKFIILNRNPIDVVKSMVKTWDINNLTTLSKLSRDILIAPQRLKQLSETYIDNPNVYSVDYESLIVKTSETISSLYNWLKLPYSSEVLNTSTNSKYKGKYGDPYNNDIKGYDKAKMIKENTFLEQEEFLEFLEGYRFYLGASFLEAYNENVSVNKTTKVFEDFLFLNKDILSTKKQDIFIKNKQLRKELMAFEKLRKNMLGRLMFKILSKL